MKYQLVVLGPGKDGVLSELVSEFEERLKDLGLDPDADGDILEADRGDEVDWDGIPVAIWFGGKDAVEQSDKDILGKFLDEQFPVFPVVTDSKRFQESVPSELHRINGQDWDVARLTADVLHALRLTRPQRQAFISYKRSESRGVAVQVFEALVHRGYRAFLDTASIESGVDFQEALWGRMADVDLLVFLDSPNALSSRWVYQELARAHDLGLGALQLIWPNHSRTSGTEFSDFVQVQMSDFQHGTADKDDLLTTERLDEFLVAAERARIRSLNARRLRVVADLTDQAMDVGLDAVVHPVESVELQRNGTRVASVVPFVGLPDGPSIQREEQHFQPDGLTNVRIVYDGLGMDPSWLDHLEWLNLHHGLQTTQVENIGAWLGEL